MDDELAGMTIANAAAFIMERFGGEAKVTDLAMMLQSTGVMKGNPNNAYSSVYKTLKRMPGRFQSIRRGVFSLAAPDAEAVAEELVHAEPSQ